MAKKKISTAGVAKKSRVAAKSILTHVDAHGRAAMVDVGEKAVTELRRDHVYIWSEAKVTAKTGVEMEALLAVAIAALTVIDMGKSIDRAMTIQGLRMLEKEGGRSGHFVAGAKARR